MFIPRHYRVQIARVGVISPLVRTVELLGGDAAVLEVLRVSARLVTAWLGPPALSAQAAAESHHVVVGGLTAKAGHINTSVWSRFLLDFYLVSARQSSSQSLLFGTCSTILSSKPSSFLLRTLSKAQALSLHWSTAPLRQIFSK